MREIDAAQVAQLDPFELLPEALPRVELRGIGWQAFQVEPLRRAIGQKLANDVTAVDRGPSQITTRRPGTSRRRCSKKATTSDESIASS